ncbi:MAG: CoA-binding protein [Acidobacteria bacterium]|nr:CoA-binding protein [Acidobacteriota bacterium]
MPVASLQGIQNFLKVQRIAIIGVSRNEKDYSRILMRDFQNNGIEVVPVHPTVEEMEGVPAFHAVTEVHPVPEAAIILVPEDQLLAATRQSIAAGIRMLWYRHSENSSHHYRSAIATAKEAGVEVVDGECPLMFLPKAAWFHRAHGFVNRITGSYPR